VARLLDPNRRLLRTRCERPRSRYNSPPFDEIASSHWLAPMAKPRWNYSRDLRSTKWGSGVSLNSSNFHRPMSALGQEQTLRGVRPMSALPPKADIAEYRCHVRFVPKADIWQGSGWPLRRNTYPKGIARAAVEMTARNKITKMPDARTIGAKRGKTGCGAFVESPSAKDMDFILRRSSCP
jgi:hypothetical protein